MRTSIRLAAAAAALSLVLPVATVQATTPLEVSFAVQTSDIDGGPVTGGPFTASGPAVDEGLICAAGQTVDDSVPHAAGFQSQIGVNVRLVKRFTCADGSGDFWVTLQIRFDARGNNFIWLITDGADEYARLHGTGSGFGVPTGGGVLDLYDGTVHVD